MGRRHLSLLVAVALAVGLATPAASAGLRWREVARGNAVGVQASDPFGLLALNRQSAARFSAALPAAGRAALSKLDFRRDAVVALFAEFGCKDHRVAVRRLAISARILVVTLVERRPAPGTVECQAIYPTYRLLAVARGQLNRVPVAVEVRLARA